LIGVLNGEDVGRSAQISWFFVLVSERRLVENEADTNTSNYRKRVIALHDNIAVVYFTWSNPNSNPSELRIIVVAERG
jgi:hypothetical protein